MVDQDISATAILNVYKRPETLHQQLQCLANQSMKVDEVLIWVNGLNENEWLVVDDAVKSTALNVKTFRSSYNEGVWPRFMLSLLAKGDFVCILDDDVAPGRRWLENAVRCSVENNAICGSRGLVFKTKGHYFPFDHYGWGNANEEDVQVDIIGHAWVFRRQWILNYWGHQNSMHVSPFAGEDMHFSAALQPYGIKTFVPRHPVADRELWGNAYFSEKIGQDENAISLRSDAYEKFDKHLQFYINSGFRLLCEDASSGFSRETNLRLNRNGRLSRLIRRNNFIYRLSQSLVKIFKKIGIHI